MSLSVQTKCIRGTVHIPLLNDWKFLHHSSISSISTSKCVTGRAVGSCEACQE